MPLLDLFWAMLWFFLFCAWFWLLISVFSDIFRNDMSGWGKALWSILVICVPLLGVLVYLIVHGGDMQERSRQQAVAMERAHRDYIREVASTSTTDSTADELAKLARLRDQGVITETEFAQQKTVLLR
jgi:hypothetical protein